MISWYTHVTGDWWWEFVLGVVVGTAVAVAVGRRVPWWATILLALAAVIIARLTIDFIQRLA